MELLDRLAASSRERPLAVNFQNDR
jgi:hypothetical protein